MLDNFKIESGADYANSVIKMMKETELEVPENERTPLEFMELWFNEIREFADKTWIEYITGKRENYIFSTIEMMDLYNNANENYVQNSLNSLVDKDLIQVGISENGEMMYSLTDEGKNYVENNLLKK